MTQSALFDAAPPAQTDPGESDCHKCGKSLDAAGGLYTVTHGEDAGQEACFDCLPDADVDEYPGWRERMAAKRQRAERAKKNFGHGG